MKRLTDDRDEVLIIKKERDRFLTALQDIVNLSDCHLCKLKDHYSDFLMPCRQAMLNVAIEALKRNQNG